ncbi:hypothetical protein KFK09_014143 [Dendrobium nobile]|uniref:Uncharacterized protein n=1 Tax=Dendrobium nobile TaxID=94219 RepID=A0A8T3BB73_DENNO|nr:hypothetical protein KFK09_014143 [Dendrobium nobile]
MSLLDEFDALNKKHAELSDAHDSLKSSHAELKKEFKKLKNLKTFENKKPSLHVSHKKKHHHMSRLVHPFLGVRCFSCCMLGHIAHTCTIHHSSHWV